MEPEATPTRTKAKPKAVASAPAPVAPRARISRRAVIALISTTATGLSLVLAFVAILPILTQNASGVDKLDLRFEPYRPGALLVYSVPADTALRDYEMSAVDAPCTAHQQEWLADHGARVDAYYFVTITNRATSGNVIGFGDMVGAGEASTPATGSVLIECDTAGSTTRIAPARLDPASGSPAYYDRSRMNDAGESPDTPVIYNLQPGESGQFVLLIASTQNFSGEVEYTVTSGSDTLVRTMDFDDGVTTSGTAPNLARLLLTSDPLWSGCASSDTVAGCVAAS